MEKLVCEKCEQAESSHVQSFDKSWHCSTCGHINHHQSNDATKNWVDPSVEHSVGHRVGNDDASFVENQGVRTAEDDAASSIPPFRQGEQIEHFVIQRLVGTGGFGYVFLAFDQKLERSVALKIPHERRISNARKADFLREAKMMAKLASPHVVSVFEVGETDGRIWIASEFVDGRSLSAHLGRKQILPESEVISICKSICKGVQAAHELRIIHRDLKPGNILISRAGNVVVTDFGLAFRDEPSSDGQIHGVVGTIPYMSPEQIEAADMVDRRTDIYSIGVILYEMLAGKRPYRGSRSDLISQILEAEPVPPHRLNRQVSQELEAVCLKCLARSPEARYQSAREVLEDLERVSNGDAPNAFQPNWVKRLGRQLRMKRSEFIAATAVLLLIAVVFASWNLLGPQELPATVNEGTFPVVVTLDRPNVKIAIVPIDSSTFNPDPSKAIHPEPGMQISVDLEPGLYLVEAVGEIAGEFVVHEVLRTVPPRLVDPLVYKCQARNYTIDQKSGSVAWPAISLSSRGNFDFVDVEGGSFKTGSNGLLDDSPAREVEVAPFKIMSLEVTVGEFERVMSRIPGGMTRRFDDGNIDPMHCVTDVSFYDAIEFCERTQMRLPTLEEFLFVATNRGKTAFPWGDSLRDTGAIDSVKPPSFDETSQPVGVKGLASRVGEWTQTGTEGRPLFEGLTLEPVRILADYPKIKNEGTGPSLRKSIRFFGMESLNKVSSDIGFRGVRSLKPRFAK